MLNVINSHNFFLKNIPFFQGMEESDIADLISNANIKEYKKKEALFLHGDKADRLFIIIDGCIKCHKETPEGEEAIIYLLTKGDMFGETAIFGNAQYPLSAHIVEDAKTLEISATFLREKANQSESLRASFMQMMSDEMSHLRLENEHMALMSTPQRVSCLLLQLSTNLQGKGGTFNLPYDKSLAATLLGMKPETFSRALNQLKPLGVTINGSEVTISNFEHLIEYTCSHCTAVLGECHKASSCACARARPCSNT